MLLPLQITFRNMPPSSAVENKITEQAEKLNRYVDNITHCKVVVESPHKHQHKGAVYHIKLDVTLPGTEIVVSREPELNHAHEDIYIAIRDAFAAAKRQIEEYLAKRTQHVKRHGPVWDIVAYTG